MFTRTQPDGVWLGAGYVPGAADWQDLNEKLFHAVNGVRGGTWAPKSAIRFDGNFEVTGPTLIAHGGELETDRLELDGEDTWPQFAPGHALRKRTIVQSMLKIRGNNWRVTPDASIQTLALGFLRVGNTAVVKPGRGTMDIEVHDSATLSHAVFTFRVPLVRGFVPFTMPKFRIVRVDRDGKWEPLASRAVGADEDGWQSPAKVTSVLAWHNEGRVHEFTYVCDQHNVIDVSHYAYKAEIIEEDLDPNIRASSYLVGVVSDERTIRYWAPDVELVATSTLPNPALSGSLLIDGIGTWTGQSILITKGINNNEAGTAHLNGIWIANSAGAWTRSTDVAGGMAIPFFVFVRQGAQHRGSSWQLARPYPRTISDTSVPDGSANVFFERFTLSGNKYHAVALHFDNITEMRWQ